MIANGNVRKHSGEKHITFRDLESKEIFRMTFQVTEVKKVLAVVWRLAEKGNIVQFKPEEQHNFIKNVTTCKKIMMHKKGRSSVLKVEFVEWMPKDNSVFGGQAK